MDATDSDGGQEAIRAARALFPDDRHLHGCAETTLIALKGAFGLAAPSDAQIAVGWAAPLADTANWLEAVARIASAAAR